MLSVAGLEETTTAKMLALWDPEFEFVLSIDNWSTVKLTGDD